MVKKIKDFYTNSFNYIGYFGTALISIISLLFAIFIAKNYLIGFCIYYLIFHLFLLKAYTDMTDIYKTSQQWYEIARKSDSEFVIMDPDGWDRTNYQYSFHEELITSVEFWNRVFRSTVIRTNKNLNK